MDRQHLLPSGSAPLTIALSETLDRSREIGIGVEALHSFKFANPLNPTVTQWLILEYGLGIITPFIPVPEDVVLLGSRWNRVKGTPEAIRQALSWINYAYNSLYEMPVRRIRWHLFEIELDRFPDDEAHLNNIEQLAWLSQPVRSDFWRGYCGYNIRELDWSHSKWGHAIWGDCSGARLHTEGAKWSFGRKFTPPAGEHALTQFELTQLDAWVPSDGSGSIGWVALNSSWQSMVIPWVSDGENARSAVIAAVLLPKSLWVTLYREDLTVIGSRKAKEYLSVVPSLSGAFTIDQARYSASNSDKSRIYAEALTDFAEGSGEVLKYWSFIIGAEPPSSAPAGKQWHDGDQLIGGVSVGMFEISSPIKLTNTSRESFRAILRIV